MLGMKDYLGGIRAYRVLEPPQVLADVQGRIEALESQMQRRGAALALERLRRALGELDLSGLGWPPQATSDGADLLHADTQRQLSAVLRVDHKRRTVFILRYVLKVRP